ncbi:P-loop containing nucleoside triphosphate hydrolase [Pseudocohnilembus persalinus]|uniref:p-loop containing nucleoside triphosphate hydrolase n=1 Tax=Pseudocohnilembus persalinus TaxID=266149 RepID=A0A0V0QB96_PSEPJ|nr:P-loop containing nucleoside triphosphate hydrolase [Pseudocohnilembus persalinus]|eukprot:KRW99458.1 P-loop containing nucleoside triphosphate hydrolase [Pseudocohnilembus persalinus]
MSVFNIISISYIFLKFKYIHCKGKFLINHRPTVGVDYMTSTQTIDNRIITLQIWDTAGQETFQSVCSSFYRGADVVVFVFDITNQESFENLNKWKQEYLDAVGESDLGYFMVVGNKIDLALQNNYISNNELERWCRQNRILKYYVTSSKDGTKIDDLFSAITKTVTQSDHQNIYNNMQNKIQLDEPNKKKFLKKCC